MKKSFTTLTQHNKSLWTLNQIMQMHQSLKDDVIIAISQYQRWKFIIAFPLVLFADADIQIDAGATYRFAIG